MSFKRVLYVLISIAILAIVIGAAIARSSDLAAVPVSQPAWQGALIQDYEAKHGEVDTTTEQLILAGVNASCGDLVANRSLPQVWQMNVDNGMSSDMSATTIELAVQYYCPQYRQLLDRESN